MVDSLDGSKEDPSHEIQTTISCERRQKSTRLRLRKEAWRPGPEERSRCSAGAEGHSSQGAFEIIAPLYVRSFAGFGVVLPLRGRLVGGTGV